MQWGLPISVVAVAVLCTGTSSADEAVTLTKEQLAAKLPGLSVDAIHDGPHPNLYEVVVDSRVSYVTTDGRYLIQGDIIDLETRQNLTNATRARGRAELFAAVDPATEIVFSPASSEVKHRVVVFTDVDCGYCRQFHREMEVVNDLGIEVRYLAYPRTGPNTESWAKAEGVWCAADRKEALTRAKLGAEIPRNADCDAAAVAAEYNLGRRIALVGTPAIYSESGVELGGYLTPQQLLEALERID